MDIQAALPDYLYIQMYGIGPLNIFPAFTVSLMLLY